MIATTTLPDIISRGYFPRELPPPFTTGSYGSYIRSLAGAALPFDTTAKKFRTSRAEIYNLARAGSFRRELAVLNPIHFATLADCIVTNWRSIVQLTESKISLTTPTPRPDGRSIGRRTSLDDLPRIRAKVRSQGTFLLKADVIRFYPSIYTHSIPWAVHGKAFAKANRGLQHWGNRLDMLMRNCQDAQTNGIPVGPDTSLVIAELLLARVDRELTRRRMRGMRYMDDYELVFDSEEQALEARTQLQQALLEYELSLSATKTGVYALPQQLEEPWVAELNLFPLAEGGLYFKTQLIRFFDRAFHLARQFPQEGVLKYAAGRIAKLRITSTEAQVVEDLLMQSALVEAGALAFVLLTMLKHPARDADQRKRRHVMLQRIISSHAGQRHSSEVAWAIWACIVMKLQLSRSATKAVVAMEDSVCALLALHARRLGLVRDPNSLRPLRDQMNSEALYGPRWLLAYEANVKGWFQFRGAKDYVAHDRNFRYLKTAGVSFYDVSKTVVPQAPATAHQIARVIKDYISRITATYDQETDEEDGDDPFDDDIAVEIPEIAAAINSTQSPT